MKPFHIHSAVCISAQDSFEGGEMILLETSEEKVNARHPNYRDFIPPAAARRMAPAVKMGVVAATKALQNAELEHPDAIITGSGMGCMQDTEKFLNALLENNEEYLTPTSFIQSTHNTVGGQIALGLHCKAYNTTYAHGSLSFESALLDAQLALQEGSAKNILIGGIDELGTEFVDYLMLNEQQEKYPKKVPYGEGAAFFVVSQVANEKSIVLKDVQTFRTIPENRIGEKVLEFLRQHRLEASAIEMLFLGNTGDGFDGYYDSVSSEFSPGIKQVPFKKYSGYFYTCISFAVWWGFEVMRKENHKENKHVLIYNQEKGQNHSFILLSRR